VATNFFDPVFAVYNQALTDKEQKRMFEGTNDKGVTKQFDDEDEAMDFDEYGSCDPVETQVAVEARAAAKQHRTAIKDEMRKIPVNQASAPTWQLTDATKKYRMEKIDVNHRMGDYLAGAYAEFKSQPLKNANFWQWLTAQSADDQKVKNWNPALFEQAQANPQWQQYYLKWFRKGVKYLANEETRDRYRVEIDGGIMKRKWKRGDAQRANFDTKKLIAYIKTKYPGMNFQAIWVLSPADSFYSHVVKIGRFHHSSLLAGTAVKAAGEWGVEDGKLKWINGKSGHYRPELARFVAGLELLQNSGVVATDAVVRLYVPAGTVAEKVPVPVFLANVKSNTQFYKKDGKDVFC
jgi:hypothetical protein